MQIDKYLKMVWTIKSKKTFCDYKPFQVHIEPTNNCNLNCSFCARDKMKRKKGVMDFNLFKKMVDDSNSFLETVHLYLFGESTLHKQLPSMVAFLTKRGVKTVLYTNGIVVNKMASDLIDAGLDAITFSVNAHPKIVEKETKTFVEIRNKRKKPIVTVRLLKQLEDSFVLSHVDKVVVKDLHNYAGALNHAYTKENYHGCCYPFYMLAVTWNGDVTICCRDYDCMAKVGNVAEESLHDIWNNELIRSYRKRLIDQKYIKLCHKCDRLYQPWLNPKSVIGEVSKIIMGR